MKIPKIKKLPSGSYFCRIRTGGRDHAITGSTYDIVYAEAVAYKAGIIKAKHQPERVTVKLAAERYIEEKNNILSPSTVREYKRCAKTDLAPLHKLSVEEAAERRTMQAFLNDFAATHSPKSVRNVYRFLAAALTAAGADLPAKITLPEKRRGKLHKLPTEQDITALIDAVRETPLEVPILLAAFGSLRRSEICALRRDDVTDTGVWVMRAAVEDADKKIVIKQPKEYSSSRHAALPPAVVTLLKSTPGEHITELTPNAITKRFARVLKKNNIPHFRFHDLRSYWATVAHAMGMPDYYLMRNGGWATMETPRKHYMRDAAELISTAQNATTEYFSMLLQNGNKKGNKETDTA